MDTHKFIFRNKEYGCIIYLDRLSYCPCYVFVDLIDKDLIREFGFEITIKTDYKTRLPQSDEYPALTELRQAIFNAISTDPEFIITKNKNNGGIRSNTFSDASGNLTI